MVQRAGCYSLHLDCTVAEHTIINAGYLLYARLYTLNALLHLPLFIL